MLQPHRRRLLGMTMTIGMLAVPVTASAMCADEPPPIEMTTTAQKIGMAKLKAGRTAPTTTASRAATST